MKPSEILNNLIEGWSDEQKKQICEIFVNTELLKDLITEFPDVWNFGNYIYTDFSLSPTKFRDYDKPVGKINQEKFSGKEITAVWARPGD